MEPRELQMHCYRPSSQVVDLYVDLMPYDVPKIENHAKSCGQPDKLFCQPNKLFSSIATCSTHLML